ncbi:TRAP transporter substrate-binding protein [Brevibacillus dissolubilis]|uniref:TRAP transporter substrate-binding protein n=1 Tax=Brevibacillus dissolubilis TaxID=1844116 RepID=UPI0011171050|nr:TRAP transporter substrate-binding protein [Brevibacillus dissolubilis]
MKSFVSIGMFVVVGLLAAYFIGFRPDLATDQVGYDEIQEGMNQRIILKFSHVVAENTPKGRAAERFAQLVKEKTNGRVEVQVYPNGILYNEENEMDALIEGDVQMIAPAYSNISTMIPAWSAMDLPYAFPNQQAVEEAFDGEVGQILFETLERRKMKGLAFWSNGFKQMTNNRNPLKEPKDFAGLRFRVLPSRLLESQFAQLGATTVEMPFNEVYRNLEAGLVDGQENTLSNITTKRLYQVQRYMTLSDHGYLGYAVIVNPAFWAELPPDLRDSVSEAMTETTEWINREAVLMNQQQLIELRKSGIRIYELTPQEKQRWMKSFEPVYEQYGGQIGAELIGNIRKLQNKYTP